MAEKQKKKTLGFVFLTLFGILIITGILVKRVLGHPELMMFFHVPAAVFLILAGLNLTHGLKKGYRQQCDQEDKDSKK